MNNKIIINNIIDYSKLFSPPEDYSEFQKRDYYSDIIFLIVLTFLLLLLILFTYRSLKNEDNRNIHNYLISLTIITCLLNRYICMLYSLLVD